MKHKQYQAQHITTSVAVSLNIRSVCMCVFFFLLLLFVITALKTSWVTLWVTIPNSVTLCCFYRL